MGLYERWTADDDTKIAIHPFGSALSEMARGAATRAEVISVFNLAGDDVTELDAIATAYAALSTDNERTAFIGLLEDVMVLCEAGIYNRATAASRLGFT